MLRKEQEICYKTFSFFAGLFFLFHNSSVWEFVVGVLLHHSSTVDIQNRICKPWSVSGWGPAPCITLCIQKDKRQILIHRKADCLGQLSQMFVCESCAFFWVLELWVWPSWDLIVQTCTLGAVHTGTQGESVPNGQQVSNGILESLSVWRASA